MYPWPNETLGHDGFSGVHFAIISHFLTNYRLQDGATCCCNVELETRVSFLFLCSFFSAKNKRFPTSVSDPPTLNKPTRSSWSLIFPWQPCFCSLLCLPDRFTQTVSRISLFIINRSPHSTARWQIYRQTKQQRPACWCLSKSWPSSG